MTTSQDLSQAAPATGGAKTGSGARKGRLVSAARAGARLLARLCLVLLLCGTLVAGYLFGGFLRFSEEVALFSARPDPARLAPADGIVVLTGGAMRLDAAVSLLRQGLARRLLISGVNPGTSIDTLAELTGTPREWFDCCVDLDYVALNTIGNAEMAERWATHFGFDEIILVTSDYHMPRSLWEFDRLTGLRSLKPFAVGRGDLWAASHAPSGTGLRILLTEYAKLVVARVRAATGLSPRPADTLAVAGLPTSGG